MSETTHPSIIKIRRVLTFLAVLSAVLAVFMLGAAGTFVALLPGDAPNGLSLRVISLALVALAVCAVVMSVILFRVRNSGRSPRDRAVSKGVLWALPAIVVPAVIGACVVATDAVGALFSPLPLFAAVAVAIPAFVTVRLPLVGLDPAPTASATAAES